ncbi:MAG: nucleotide-binding protein [PVC group bacterium]|nr:nucleotide-binding protein [PVC group bacterium]
MLNISKVFIGHGHSNVWKDLKDFLSDRLSLEWEEFNREATAGKSTKERLEEMLNECDFAFLVMTAEDEHGDGKKHARLNVVHEIGLFQGKLGFKKAIILMEEECEEFSNITGISQIRFPKGKLSSISEDIRKVLEREDVIVKENKKLEDLSSEQNQENKVNLDETEERILAFFSKIDQGGIELEQLTRHFGIQSQKMQYYLDRFFDMEFIYANHNTFIPTKYELCQKGRVYLVKNNLM